MNIGDKVQCRRTYHTGYGKIKKDDIITISHLYYNKDNPNTDGSKNYYMFKELPEYWHHEDHFKIYKRVKRSALI